jgi:hypothetical protein
MFEPDEGRLSGSGEQVIGLVARTHQMLTGQKKRTYRHLIGFVGLVRLACSEFLPFDWSVPLLLAMAMLGC